jgi:flavin-binding protein dodecin
MPGKTYKIIELVGVSENSISEAIQNAIARASETLQRLDWMEVGQIRGLIQNGKVSQFQVYVRVGFRVMTPEELQS